MSGSSVDVPDGQDHVGEDPMVDVDEVKRAQPCRHRLPAELVGRAKRRFVVPREVCEERGRVVPAKSVELVGRAASVTFFLAAWRNRFCRGHR